jgi:hypothetical protein
MIVDVKNSRWSRSLLVRLLVYSAGSSTLITSLKAYYLWNWPQIYFDSTEKKLGALAGTAFTVFWEVFLLGSVVLGTIHFFIALIHYRRFTARRDKRIL